MFSKPILNKILSFSITPTTDLFSSRFNNQSSTYVSHNANGNVYAVDTFSLKWNNETQNASVKDGSDFLTSLYESKKQYSTTS